VIDLFSLQRVIFSHKHNYNLKCGLVNCLMALRIGDSQCCQTAVLFLMKKSFDSWLYHEALGFCLFIAQPKMCFMEEGIIIRSAGKYTELTCLLVVMNLRF